MRVRRDYGAHEDRLIAMIDGKRGDGWREWEPRPCYEIGWPDQHVARKAGKITARKIIDVFLKFTDSLNEMIVPPQQFRTGLARPVFEDGENRFRRLREVL